MYLLDTYVLSEPSKPQPNEQVMNWLAGLLIRDAYISMFSLAELEQGIAHKGETRREHELRSYLQQIERHFAGQILFPDRAVAQAWAALTARAWRNGTPLPYSDSWLAATALAGHLIVVTRNVKDFKAVGVDILNPWEPQT